MVTTDRLFAGSIPEIYDRLLVPLIFESMRATSLSGWPYGYFDVERIREELTRAGFTLISVET